MRRMFFALIALTVVTPVRAELRCERPIADLGEVRGGPPGAHRFDLVNAGSAPVEIIGVRRDCGCLEPNLEKSHLAPGERSALTFRLRTLGQPEGRRHWQAWVQYREDGTLKETLLALSGVIRNEVTVEPSQLALYVDSAQRAEITVTDRRSPGFQLIAARASLPALKATLLPQGGGVTRVVLEVSAAELPAGRVEALLDLYSDDPYYRQLTVPVTLQRERRAAVTATPSVVRVRATGAVTAQLVRLRAAGTEKVVVETASANETGITCTWAAGPGNDATLKVRIDHRAAAPGGRVVTVQLAGEGREAITIPVIVEKE